VILLLHGWTGDENSMGFFTPRLPRRFARLSPRGLYATQPNGFSWRAVEALPVPGLSLPRLDSFTRAAEALLDWLSPDHFPGIELSRLHLMGFSQGAALAFALALLHPKRVASLTALAGFVPPGAEALLAERPLEGVRVLIAHGTQDAIIPIEQARQSLAWMQMAGAQVDYCEDEVGHKLGARCFTGLEEFYAAL
jgi:phospholipase/carboxylesterase